MPSMQYTGVPHASSQRNLSTSQWRISSSQHRKVQSNSRTQSPLPVSTLMHFFAVPGEEVCRWLASKGLSQYTSAFVSLNLDSLRKVERMTADALSKVHRKFCASTAIMGLSIANDNVGRLVMLSEAVQSLKDDERTKTLQDQLADYKDPKVSGLNLLGANHQLEVFMSQVGWKWFFICTLLVVFFYQAYWTALSFVQMSDQFKSHNMITYGVQLSLNATLWWDVVCQERSLYRDTLVEGPCIFDSSLISRSDDMATNLFARHEKARYLKILPGTWEAMQGDSNLDRVGPDFRLGILGDLGQGNLDYGVVADGSSGQAWLQPGCSRNLTRDEKGIWASQDERIGKVQCCVDSPGVHVCTRGGPR